MTGLATLVRPFLLADGRGRAEWAAPNMAPIESRLRPPPFLEHWFLCCAVADCNAVILRRLMLSETFASGSSFSAGRFFGGCGARFDGDVGSVLFLFLVPES